MGWGWGQGLQLGMDHSVSSKPSSSPSPKAPESLFQRLAKLAYENRPLRFLELNFFRRLEFSELAFGLWMHSATFSPNPLPCFCGIDPGVNSKHHFLRFGFFQKIPMAARCPSSHKVSLHVNFGLLGSFPSYKCVYSRGKEPRRGGVFGITVSSPRV